MEQGDFRDLFVSEAQDYVNILNRSTLRLEKNSQDLEAVHELFRAAHTLKGMAATMGYQGITQLCHEYESALDQIRSGAAPATQPLVDLLFEGVDALSRLIGEVAAGNESSQADASLLARIRQASSASTQAVSLGVGLAPLTQSASSLPPRATTASAPGLPSDKAGQDNVLACLAQGKRVTRLEVTLDPACTFKGVRAFLALKNLRAAGDVLASNPEGKQLEEGKFDQGFSIWISADRDPEELRGLCLKVTEVASVSAQEMGVSAPTAAQGTSEVNVALPPSPQPMKPASLGIGSAAGVSEKQGEGLPENRAPRQTVRVSVERLDHIVNMVGELVTAKIRLAQIAKDKQVKELADALVQIDHIMNELQEEAVGARMVPMEQAFSRFPRMVRDLARGLGKQIELTLEGGDIEVDRSILDEISDPLVHLLRNAIDHGIEGPELRSAQGKPATGMLKLVAKREKNQLLIIVEDDGAGIRTDKVRAAAVRKGLLSEAQARVLSEEEAINLIALPGFSTAEAVTAVSGRGVGVDAVRTKVEALGGSLRIESAVGKGSQFRVRLPLSLAIIQALLVKIGREEYAAPVANVVEAFEATAADIKSMHGQPVIMLRDEVLPVFRLDTILELPVARPALAPYFTVLVVEAGEKRAGLVVDEVVAQLEVAIKALGRSLKTVRGFGGVTILGDGRICLILDFNSLLEI